MSFLLSYFVGLSFDKIEKPPFWSGESSKEKLLKGHLQKYASHNYNCHLLRFSNNCTWLPQAFMYIKKNFFDVSIITILKIKMNQKMLCYNIHTNIFESLFPPGMDSDLEAFSCNPMDGSFAPLAVQPSTSTKCPNLQFLSYWAGLPLQ